MKQKRKIWSRLLAAAVVLTLSIAPSLSSATVYADEKTEDIVSQTQEDQQETEEPQSVTAVDITKDISDKEFSIQTSVEGISYNPERETVSLLSLKDNNGELTDAQMPGTYTATYLVVPKDQSDSYTIQRNVILTDTEGMAHTQENGPDKSKSNIETDDSDVLPSSPETPELKIKAAGQSITDEEQKEIQRELRTGETLLFSTVNSINLQGDVYLEVGDVIYYPENIGYYSTNWFYVNGKLAYCIESQKPTPPTGDYVGEVLDSNQDLKKVLYYGYGGAGDITGTYMPDFSDEQKYVFTHIAASYAYAGTEGFAGCPYENLVAAGVIGYIDKLLGMEEPPKGELSFSADSVTAVRNGEKQRTPDIVLNGDYRNHITMDLPTGITGVNTTENKNVTAGKFTVKGGDTFYLEAAVSQSGKYSTGDLYGSIGETWRTLVVSTGDVDQAVGVFESESALPVSLTVNWISMARIALVKKDADTKNPLAGAVYGIYKDKACTNLLMEMQATDSDGKCVSGYFDAGIKTVYVKEITAATNYLKDESTHTVNVEAGKTVTVQAVDKAVKGRIILKKVDADTGSFEAQGDASLEGAVFGLYAKEDIVHPDGRTGVLYPKGTLISQKTVGSEGSITFEDLYLGQMYVKEIISPESYLLQPKEYDATLSYGGQEVEIVTKSLIVEEQVKKQAFSLIKISEDGGQTETDLVEGAGFKVYLINSLTKVKDGTLKPKNGSYYTAEDFVDYDFSKETTAHTYKNKKPVPVPELFTDNKGYLVSPELAYGTYVVEESTVPENLNKVNPFIVNITEDSREPMTWRIFDDRPYQFFLKIIKRDAQTGNVVLGKEASYKIYDCKARKYVEQTVNYPKKQRISVFTTTEEGYLVTPEKLQPGTYRIEEVKAPANFVRAGSEMELFLGNEKISLLDIKMEGAYKKQEQKPITITVEAGNVSEVDPESGIPIVTIEQRNNEQVGSLTIVKTGEQLQSITEGSVLDKAKDIWNKVKEAVIGEGCSDAVFHEFKYEEEGIEGTVFEVRAKEDIVSPDGAKDNEGNPVIRYHKNDVEATLTTDDTGKATVNNLPLGSYYVKEVEAGAHFVLNTEIKEFVLTSEDDTAAVVYEELECMNERQKIEICVKKKDKVDGKTLQGAFFGLYAKENILSADGRLLLEKDTLIEQKSTDENGKLTFSSDLIHGYYYVKELRPLPGYMQSEEIWEVMVPYEDQSQAVIAVEKEFENQPTETQITKTDLTTGKELEGARLQVKTQDGKVVEEWVSGKVAHVIYGLPEGAYILHEELAPFEEGYVTANNVEFEVKADGNVVKVEMKDDISKTEIIKTDITTGKELKGAKLQVLTTEGTILEEWITDGSPHRVDQLPIGVDLILREITAPDHYEIAEDVTFKLEDTAEIQKVEMKDKEIEKKPVISQGPKTGDKTEAALCLMVLCIATAFVAAGIAYKKRRRHINGKKHKGIQDTK